MNPAGRPRRDRGVALLLVMWVFTILGVLALDFSRYMRDDAMAALNFVEEGRGYYIALAGMNKTLWQAQVDRDQNGPAASAGTEQDDPARAGMRDDDIVPADGEWHDGEFAGAKYQVRISDEAGRIALNKAGEPLLTRVITNLLVGSTVQGLGRRQAAQVAEIVDSILDWRDTDSLARPHGAESEYYLSSRGGYPAKNGNFDEPQELLRVRGVTSELYYGSEGVPGLRDVVSVFGRSGGLNARTITAPVLQALLGISADEAKQRVDERGSDAAGFLVRLQADASSIDPSLEIRDEPASTFLIEARADTSQPRNQSTVAAVVSLAADEFDGPRVLRWFDRAPWTGALPSGAIPEDQT